MKYKPIIKASEFITVEFKSFFNQEVIQAVSLSTNKNGEIIFIRRKLNSKVFGLRLAEDSLQKWLKKIKGKTEPELVSDIKTEKYKSKVQIGITVKDCLIKPVALLGRCFIRKLVEFGLVKRTGSDQDEFL